MENSENKDLKDIELGNNPENFEKFDKCTLDHYCGFKTKDNFCLLDSHCAYKLSNKYFKKIEKPTVQYIIELLQKGKIKTYQDILAITPTNEIETFSYVNSENKLITKIYIVDFNGNIFDLYKLRPIRLNYKK